MSTEPRESAPPHSATIYPEERESGELPAPPLRFEAIPTWHELPPDYRALVILSLEGNSAQWRRFAEMAPSPEIAEAYKRAASAFDAGLLALLRAATPPKAAEAPASGVAVQVTRASTGVPVGDTWGTHLANGGPRTIPGLAAATVVDVPMPGGGVRSVLLGDAPPLDPAKVAAGEAVLAEHAAAAKESRAKGATS